MSENKLEIYIAKGLTEEESASLVRYNNAGRPGVSKINVDALEALFNIGYTCQEIHAQFPEYPIGAILLARVQNSWDSKRDEYRKSLEREILNSVKNAKVEAVKMVSDLVAATNISWKQQLMRYLANPEKEKAPEFLPKTLHQYSSLATLLNDLTDINGGKDKDNNSGVSGGGGLPTIIINNNNNGPKNGSVIEVSHTQKVKEALQRQNKK